MSQRRLFSFLDLNTSQAHNERFDGVIASGVYRGYRPRVSTIGSNKVDITAGGDPESLLVTSEGVIIKESSDIIGNIQIDFSTLTLSRIDMCVCEYQYTSDTQRAAIYKIIKGAPHATDPQPPEVQNLYQVPLFYVEVGAGVTSIYQEDLKAVIPANGIKSDDIGPLKPVVDNTTRDRLYVHPGAFPNKIGTNLLTYGGGYSDSITTSDISDGETRYFLFGISDNLEVGIISNSLDDSAIDGYGADALALCIAETRRSGSTIIIEDIVDVRTPFARRLVPQYEEDSYNDVLGTSIFTRSRFDLFEDEDLIDLTTISTANVGVEIDKADTSLTFTKLISGSLATDVTITSEDLLNGLPSLPVYHIMLLLDSPLDTITFDYSTTSKLGGFTGTQHNFNSILHIPTGASNLYIKFTIPYGDLNLSPVKIFSYCVFLDLDYTNLNENAINEAGLIEVVKSQANLITNPFVWWSRPDDHGDSGTPYTNKELVYTMANTSEQISAGQSVYGPDGWQLIDVEGTVANNPTYLLKRTYKSGASVPGILFKNENYASTGVYIYEHRVMLGGLMNNRPITFSLDYDAYSNLGVSIGIQLYQLSNGELVKQGNRKFPFYGSTTSGTLVVTTDNYVGEATVAVGFLIGIQLQSIGSEVKVFNPRAVFGRQSDIQCLPDINPYRVLPYYERGRGVAVARLVEGVDISASNVLVPKHTILGEQVSEVIGEPSNINVGNVSVRATSYELTLNAVTQETGNCRLDSEWHTYIRFKKVEV